MAIMVSGPKRCCEAHHRATRRNAAVTKYGWFRSRLRTTVATSKFEHDERAHFGGSFAYHPRACPISLRATRNGVNIFFRPAPTETVYHMPRIEAHMKQVPGNPFDSIESAHHFVRLLAEAVADSKNDINSDVQRELVQAGNSSRRLKALQMAAYTLEKLELHLSRSRRLLNDLRSLRRLLFEERGAARPPVVTKTPAVARQDTAPANSAFVVSPRPQNGNSRDAVTSH